jgi:alkylated DNA repair dioxygenase AlkB
VNATLAELAPGVPKFNHVLANLYRDGTDSMGLHSDNEKELGDNPWIASLSFGAARSFQIAPQRRFRSKGTPVEKLQLSLPSGSLLLMAPPMQRYYLHGIQKTKRPVGPRLNLTFRSIVPA